MKRWSACWSGALLCAVALAQSGPALLLEQKGRVQAPSGRLSRGKVCPAGSYVLGPEASITLRFFKDGHRERAVGAGRYELKGEHLVALDSNARVECSSYVARPLAAPALLVYTQGGQVSTPHHRRPSPVVAPSRYRGGAEESGSAQSGRTSSHSSGSATPGALPAATPSGVTPADEAGGGRDDSDQAPDQQEEAKPSPIFGLQHSASGWSVLPGNSPEVARSTLTVTNLEDGSCHDVSTLLRSPDGGLLPPGKGKGCRLELTRDNQRTTLTYRSLSDTESEQLAELESARQQAGDDERIQRMDAFAALGLFHLAADEARTYLNESFSPSPQVARKLLAWYRGPLDDLAGATELRQLFRQQGWPLP